MSKLLLLIPIIIISLIVYGGMASQHAQTEQNIDKHIAEIELSAVDLVTSCNDLVDTPMELTCVTQISHIWENECQDKSIKDKLDVCTPGTGLVFKYLKGQGYGFE